MVKWSYEATRQDDGTVEAAVVIEKGGKREEYPLHHFVKHSPTGFEMGYGGSGPADLAYSILVHFYMSLKLGGEFAQQEAWIQHQDFKRDFVARERDHLVVTDKAICKWWMDKEIEAAGQRLAGQVQAENGRAQVPPTAL